MLLSLQELYDDLERYKDFDIDGNAEKFLDTVGEIIKYKDPSSISVLLNYFDDQTEYIWVIQSLIKAVESYPDEAYIKAIFNKMNSALKKCPEWFSSLINRLLNDNKCKTVFIRNIYIASQNDLLNLFVLIDQQYPHHKDFLVELRKELYNR